MELFPKCWTEAINIPIPKPKKDLTDPSNFRTFALASCVCKTLVRIINNRLILYLETNKLISQFPIGSVSTNDQLL